MEGTQVLKFLDVVDDYIKRNDISGLDKYRRNISISSAAYAKAISAKCSNFKSSSNTGALLFFSDFTGMPVGGEHLTDQAMAKSVFTKL